MKFGVNTWVWTAPLTLEEMAELAPKYVEIGCNILEVPLEDLAGMDFEQAAAILKEHGLEATTCAVMSLDRDLIHPDPSIRENGRNYMHGAIDTAAVLGAPNLAGPIYASVGRKWKQTPEEREADLQMLVPSLRELGDYAAQKGVTLCLEPINRFETSFANTAEQVVEIVDRVGHPNVQIMLDTFHMNIEEKSAGEAIRLAGPRLHHLHACENDRGAPGSGNVAWDEIAEALADIGYDGPVVIESFTPKVESIAAAAAIWRPLADSPDALATDGIAFLKSLLS